MYNFQLLIATKDEELAVLSSDSTSMRLLSDAGNSALPTVQYIVFLVNITKVTKFYRAFSNVKNNLIPIVSQQLTIGGVADAPHHIKQTESPSRPLENRT